MIWMLILAASIAQVEYNKYITMLVFINTSYAIKIIQLYYERNTRLKIKH